MSYIGNPIISTDFPKDTFSGTGSATAFTMSIAPASVNAVIVIVSGVTQDPSTYTISGTTLTFSAAPPSGTNNISVRHLGVAGIPNVPATASVTSASLAAQDLAINGVTVGKGVGSMSTATVVGSGAMAATNTGADNTAIGYVNLRKNTSGANNTGVGSQAFSENTTGSSNTAIGRSALSENTTGSFNTAVGNGALVLNTTASNNTAVGYQAGYSNTTGASNVFIGRLSGNANTTGTQNCFVGDAAGNTVTTGNYNTILGAYNGNQGGLDIRTASNYVVLSDGNGNIKGHWDSVGYYKQSTNTGFYAIHRIENTSNTSGCGTYWSQIGANANNTNSYHFIAGTGTADVFYVYGNGNVVNKNNSYGTLSDIKLKENIVDATPKLDKVLQLQVRNFNLKYDSSQKQIGFIAQEFEQVFPSMVDETQDRAEDGSILDTYTKSIKTSVLVPILVKAIQELNAKVEAQATTLATQAAEIQALKDNNNPTPADNTEGTV